MPPQFEEKIIEVVKTVCENFKKFKVKIKAPRKFINDDNQTIYHSPIASSKLHVLNDTLRAAFQLNQIPFSQKYPEFKPHVTICYQNEGELSEFRNIKPEGEFIVDQVWCWRSF
jgi:2'-5' RNA ligase